jgi:hypothetical protein
LGRSFESLPPLLGTDVAVGRRSSSTIELVAGQISLPVV